MKTEKIYTNEKIYTEREFEIAFCIGMLNRQLSTDELAEELLTAKDKISRLKEAIGRGDFEAKK